jgi:hypothetical protein
MLLHDHDCLVNNPAGTCSSSQCGIPLPHQRVSYMQQAALSAVHQAAASEQMHGRHASAQKSAAML